MWCDGCTGTWRPLVPPELCHMAWTSILKLAHRGIHAMCWLMSNKFVWPGLATDCCECCRQCTSCNKANHHSFPPTGQWDCRTVPLTTERCSTCQGGLNNVGRPPTVGIAGLPLKKSHGCQQMRQLWATSWCSLASFCPTGCHLEKSSLRGHQLSYWPPRGVMQRS